MEEKYEQIEKDAIISLKESETLLIPHSTFKVSELINAIGSKILNDDQRGGKVERFKKLTAWGIECEILTPGKNWRTGRVRLSLEFLPDEPEIEETAANNGTKNKEPESPLDDLRQMMNQENS